ncbi:hypothetical protein OSB04_003079 [Centaurea solstitialis]|uniref:Integrase catalytic domain-containing protein n=1 Tax=Centaurea solstitialis TaxID=347529 RepID=A0AA38UC32_9ASTR|nr:hypothetical protein OSB04_003079 [Centaurea solstitialis]
MGTRLDLSTLYQPQTNGQTEGTIQTLEDMLCARVMEFGGSWDNHLLLTEFSYNNSYHTNIQCAPYEALYGRKCRSQLSLLEVLLKVSPWKGLIRFGKKGKLSPRFVGPFVILERIEPVAYKLDLPPELSSIHDTFHVSNLKKCLSEETVVLPLEEIQIDEQLRTLEEPIEILDREIKQLRRSRIPIIKVRWNSRHGPESTWEREAFMKNKYPHLFIKDPCEFAFYTCGLGSTAEVVRGNALPMWFATTSESKPPTLNREELQQWKIRMINFLEGIHPRITEFLDNPPYIPVQLIPRVPATATTAEIPEFYQPKLQKDWDDEDKEMYSLAPKCKRLYGFAE